MRPRRARTRRAGLILLWLLGAAGARAEDRLFPGVPSDATLMPGQPQVFLVDVAAGSALHLRLDHLHLDVVVRVLAPDGEVIGEGCPFGTAEPVTLTVVVPRAGAQRIEARLRSPTAREGAFRLRIDPPHPATEADRRRIGAERKRYEADRLGDVDEAAGFPRMFDLYRQSIDEFRALGDDFEQATALLLMADMLEQANRLEDAREALERAVPLFRSAGEAGGESRTLDELGLVHSERGELHTALDLYAQALALRRSLGPSPWSEGRIINGMAIAYANLGDPVRAIDRYTEALPYAREAGDETAYAVALKNRGGQYLDLGDTERGMQDLEAARSRFRALGRPREEGLAEYFIGTGWQNEKRYDQALQSFQRALPLLEKAGNERFVALVFNHMGLVRLAQGHPDEAATLLADALRRIEAGGDRRTAATIRVNQARVLTEKGHFDEARTAMLALCPSLREFGDRLHEGNCNYYLAQAELGGGHLPEALAHTRAAIQAIEETRGTIQASSQRAGWLAAGHPRYELLGAVLVALNAREPGKGWDAAALEASESARARSLLEVLSAARVDVQSGVDPSLLAAGKRLDERAERARRTLRSVLGREHKREEADQVERELETLRVEREALQQKMRASSPRYAALVPAAPLSLSEIREKVLDDSTTLLEYLVGEKQSFVYAVSRSRIDVAVIPGREALEHAVTAVIRRWSNPGAPDDATGPAAALSRMVLGPVAGGLGGNTLLVVADGPLQQLPFAALPDPKGGGALLDRFTLVSSPSASVLAALRTGREAPRADGPALAILADPVVEGRAIEVGPTGPELASLVRALEEVGLHKLEPLPGSRREARQIASYLPPEQVLTALGADASRETALGPDVARARIVHFATHALLDVRRPELSGIVVSERDTSGRPRNGFLSLADVSSMRLSAELVVLSACRTGLGKDVRGEGLVGLTRGFMNAGAPRVLASLWKVSDTATASLMSRFYRELLEGRRSPAEALRHAQRAMRRERRTSAPHAWAGFVLEGDWRPLDTGGAATAR